MAAGDYDMPLMAATSQLSLGNGSSTGALTKKSKRRSGKGGTAAQTITEECERLFCETLRATFLVEREVPEQDSRVTVAPCSSSSSSHDKGAATPSTNTDTNTNACSSTCSAKEAPGGHHTKGSHATIDTYMEMWDYAGGARFRGFTAADPDDSIDGSDDDSDDDSDDTAVEREKTLFVFFDGAIAGKDLKQGLMALIDLADTDAFNATALLVCVDRELKPADRDRLLRDLRWVGFEACTLARWSGVERAAATTRNTAAEIVDARMNGVKAASGDVTSGRWIMMGMDI